MNTWSRDDLARALRATGVGEGNVVYFQVCHESLGPAQGAATHAELARLMYTGLIDVIGPAGTIIAPSYTFSFCRRQLFDPDVTPTLVGPWNTFTAFPEFVRQLPGAIRSCDPIFSNVGVGPRAAELLSGVPHVCLGNDSIHARMRRVGGKICILGVGLFEAIFRHYVESVCRVPWRFDKQFAGTIRENGIERKETWLYNVRILAPNGNPAGEALEALARSSGVCRAAPVGASEIVAVDAEPYFELASRELARDPWFTAQGPSGDALAIEEERTGGSMTAARLPPAASMMQIVDALWQLPRDLLSNGYDAALKGLSTLGPMTIHEYPTGTSAWNQVVPEKWTCREAWLEAMDGRRLFSYADHPLHVVSYSLPVDSVVSREELLRHLHVHPRLPEAIPFLRNDDERDWGLCCSQVQRKALTDAQYRVVIRSIFSYATLKVGEIVVPGASEETVFLTCNLGDPCMANDGLSGIAVAIDVVRALLTRPQLRHTYRVLVAPAMIGTVAYLSRNERLIPKIKAVLFLDMLGKDTPHLLQDSRSEDSDVDRGFANALVALDPEARTGGFRTMIGDGEDPLADIAARVPLLSLRRVLPHGDPDQPYREHHSSDDTPSIIAARNLERSRDVILGMFDAFEANHVPESRW